MDTPIPATAIARCAHRMQATISMSQAEAAHAARRHLDRLVAEMQRAGATVVWNDEPLHIVIEDYGDGMNAYPYTTRPLAEGARAALEAIQTDESACCETLWILEAPLNGPTAG